MSKHIFDNIQINTNLNLKNIIANDNDGITLTSSSSIVEVVPSNINLKGVSVNIEEDLNISKGLKLGDSNLTDNGVIKFTGTDVLSRINGAWISMTNQVSASNLGDSNDGEGLFTSKTNYNLNFKRLKAGTNISFNTNNNDFIEISSGSNNIGNSTGIVSVNNGIVTLEADNQILFKTNGVNRTYINSNGNVGIGITDPDKIFEILNTSTQQKWSYDADSYAELTVADNSHTTISTGETGDLLLSPSGNVGIGLTNPSEKLDVDGNVKISGSTNMNGAIVLGDSNSDDITVNGSIASNVIPKTDNTIDLGSSSNRYKEIYGKCINIDGSATITGNLAISGNINVIHTNTSTTEQIKVTNDGTGPALVVKQRGNQPVMNVMDTNAGSLVNGNGVVTTSGSSTNVTLNATDYNNIQLDAEITANSVVRNVISKNGNNTITIDSAVNWDNSSAGYSFTYKNPIHAIYVKDGGYVGIGTTNPSEELEVIGTIKSTNFVGSLANCTGLPISTGVSGLGTNVATFLTTPSSSNLKSVITDETGSGNLVFSNSPTLVSPILGTPTSGDLTNYTGLPISTGVSGLGSNVATFLATPSSSNLRTVITDETGTGDLVFATSPTLVTPALGTPSSGVLTNCTGTANGLRAGESVKINVNTSSSSSDHYVTFSSGGGGSQQVLNINSNLKYIPSSNVLYASLQGGINVNTQSDNTDYYLAFVSDGGGQIQGIKNSVANGGAKINASTSHITAPRFIGNLTGNLDTTNVSYTHPTEKQLVNNAGMTDVNYEKDTFIFGNNIITGKNLGNVTHNANWTNTNSTSDTEVSFSVDEDITIKSLFINKLDIKTITAASGWTSQAIVKIYNVTDSSLVGTYTIITLYSNINNNNNDNDYYHLFINTSNVTLYSSKNYKLQFNHSGSTAYYGSDYTITDIVLVRSYISTTNNVNTEGVIQAPKFSVGNTSSNSLIEVVDTSTSGDPDTRGITLHNTINNNTNAHANLLIRTGGSGGGDPILTFDIQGEAGWSTGIDNSDSNKFKISNTWNSLDSATKLTIDTNGNVGIGTSNPSANLQVNGTNSSILLSGAWNSGNYFRVMGPSSDKRLEFNYDNGTGLFDNNQITFNTNSSERMRIKTDGKVGIGTNNPDTTLDVNGNFRISNSGSEYHRFESNGFTAYTPVRIKQGGIERFTFNNISGNLGIGTTTPSEKLDVVGTIQSTGFKLTTNPTNGYVLTTDANGVGTWQQTASVDKIYENNTTVETVENNNDGHIIFSTDGTENMRLINSGNLGIGTTNPAQKLDVVGTIQSTGFKLTTNPTNGYVLTTDANGVGTWQQTASVDKIYENNTTVETVENNNDGHIIFSTDGTENMRLINSGNLGIGTTTPGQKLDVVGTIQSTGFKLTTNPTNGYVLTTDANGVGTWQQTASVDKIYENNTTVETVENNNDGHIIFSTDGTENMRLINSGNLGIGTTTPGQKLDVVGTIQSTGFKLTTNPTNNYVLTSDANGVASWQATQATGSAEKIYEGHAIVECFDNSNDDYITFSTSSNDTTSVERMRITKDGKIGIGITDPSQALELNGMLNISQEQSSTPSAPSSGDGGLIYIKNDGRLYYSSNSVSETDVISNSSTSNSSINFTDKTLALTTGSNYGNFSSGYKTLHGLSHSLTEGTYIIIVDWVAEFIGAPYDEHTLEFVYSESDLNPSAYNSTLNNVTSIKTINSFKSNKNDNNTTIILTVPSSKTYYLYWKRYSSSSFYWGTTNTYLKSENYKISYIKPSSSFSNTKTYTLDFTSSGTNYSNYISGYKTLYQLNNTLTNGNYYIFFDWTTEFINSPIGEHSIEIYYSETSTTPSSYTDTISGMTLLKTISSFKANKNNNSTAIAFNVPLNKTYYLVFIRKSTAAYTWGTNTGQLKAESFNVHYVKNQSDTAYDIINYSNTRKSVSCTTASKGSYGGDYVANNYINLRDLDHSLSGGTREINVSWTSKFTSTPPNEQILELYYKTSSFGTTDVENSAPSGGTLLKTIYRSASIGNNHSISEKIYVSVPTNDTYYFRWVRRSASNITWGTNANNMNTDSFDVDYIIPSIAVTNGYNKLEYNNTKVEIVDSASSNTDGHIKFTVENTEKLRINNNGFVGIGTSTPSNRLHIKQYANDDGGDLGNYSDTGLIIEKADNTNNWALGINGHSDLQFWYNKSDKGYLSIGTGVGQIDFTGQHRNNIIDNENDLQVGMIVISTGIIKNFSVIDEPNVNETLPVCKLSYKSADKRVFGVYSGSEDINKHTNGIYCTNLNPLDNSVKRYYVNSSGEGAILVCNEGGNIENGDYIMSSNTKGVGMKQDSIYNCNYTIAKATMDYKFNGNETKLIGCIYLL